ncbi:Uncharacterised protein [Chromobacterium violaceum]|uniref:Uncharacterized protein n=1 Tax=Chromobacterium violaceum TaxID=536 RepID=A0A3S4IZH9_CHRVL|nr:Uncharacterised protein [Chromobacterium violaceum]
MRLTCQASLAMKIPLVSEVDMFWMGYITQNGPKSFNCSGWLFQVRARMTSYLLKSLAGMVTL